ncbi:metabolite traffic protein EboE [Myxococcota bacterium]|nr:metabolite traffic protein EboE [Myxococcota bacterium]
MEHLTADGRRLHLGYCTNVHPGESLAEVEGVLRREVAAVRDRVAPGRAFGLGLRLGNTATTALADDPAALEAFAATLDDLGFYVFTVNGFPYGDFAAATVKAAVYRPDWRTDARRTYTRRLAAVLAALPGPERRTISTVAGGFKSETPDPGALAEQLEASARDLAALADASGVHIRLCLEPEPFTTLETTDEVLEFFARHLLPRGEHVRSHLGLCWDSCHQAVQFEDPVAALDRLADAGIVIGKMQVSSALHLDRPGDAAARAALFAYDEPRYLHQVVGRFRGSPGLPPTLRRAVDLPAVRADETVWRDAEAWRCHFHVPIGWEGENEVGLGTTRADWVAGVRHAVSQGRVEHLEVETYTWDVLPAALRAERLGAAGGALTDALAAEIDALRAELGGGPA